MQSYWLGRKRRLIVLLLCFRDVLAYPLALPEAIAKATSHKQLEAISHMGVGTV